MSIEVEQRDHLLLIGVRRAQKMNALDKDMYHGLARALHRLEHDPDLWVGVIWAEGPHFTSGVDLSDWAEAFASGSPFPVADGRDRSVRDERTAPVEAPRDRRPGPLLHVGLGAAAQHGSAGRGHRHALRDAGGPQGLLCLWRRHAPPANGDRLGECPALPAHGGRTRGRRGLPSRAGAAALRPRPATRCGDRTRAAGREGGTARRPGAACARRACACSRARPPRSARCSAGWPRSCAARMQPKVSGRSWSVVRPCSAGADGRSVHHEYADSVGAQDLAALLTWAIRVPMGAKH